MILSVNERALAVSEIAIVWNNKKVTSLQSLRSLLLGLGDSEQAQVTEADTEAAPVAGAEEIAA